MKKVLQDILKFYYSFDKKELGMISKEEFEKEKKDLMLSALTGIFDEYRKQEGGIVENFEIVKIHSDKNMLQRGNYNRVKKVIELNESFLSDSLKNIDIITPIFVLIHELTHSTQYELENEESLSFVMKEMIFLDENYYKSMKSNFESKKNISENEGLSFSKMLDHIGYTMHAHELEANDKALEFVKKINSSLPYLKDENIVPEHSFDFVAKSLGNDISSVEQHIAQRSKTKSVLSESLDKVVFMSKNDLKKQYDTNFANILSDEILDEQIEFYRSLNQRHKMAKFHIEENENHIFDLENARVKLESQIEKEDMKIHEADNKTSEIDTLIENTRQMLEDQGKTLSDESRNEYQIYLQELESTRKAIDEDVKLNMKNIDELKKETFVIARKILGFKSENDEIFGVVQKEKYINGVDSDEIIKLINSDNVQMAKLKILDKTYSHFNPIASKNYLHLCYQAIKMAPKHERKIFVDFFRNTMSEEEIVVFDMSYPFMKYLTLEEATEFYVGLNKLPSSKCVFEDKEKFEEVCRQVIAAQTNSETPFCFVTLGKEISDLKNVKELDEYYFESLVALNKNWNRLFDDMISSTEIDDKKFISQNHFLKSNFESFLTESDEFFALMKWVGSLESLNKKLDLEGYAEKNGYSLSAGSVFDIKKFEKVSVFVGNAAQELNRDKEKLQEYLKAEAKLFESLEEDKIISEKDLREKTAYEMFDEMMNDKLVKNQEIEKLFPHVCKDAKQEKEKHNHEI